MTKNNLYSYPYALSLCYDKAYIAYLSTPYHVNVFGKQALFKIQ